MPQPSATACGNTHYSASVGTYGYKSFECFGKTDKPLGCSFCGSLVSQQRSVERSPPGRLGVGWGGSAEPFSAEYAVHTSARGAADVNSSGRHQRGSQALLGPRRGAVRPEAGASCCSAEDTTATCCHTASLSQGAQRVTPSQHHALPAREGPQGSSGTTFLGKSVV